MSAIARFRHGRSEREVRVVMALAAIVALLLVFAFVWLPLERARTRLQSELPTLRASLDAMRAQAAEAKRLRAMPLAANRAAPLATLASSPPAGCQATVLDPRRVRLTAADASFTTIVEWLGAAQASHGLQVDSAHVDALGAAGRVKADIVLARP